MQEEIEEDNNPKQTLKLDSTLMHNTWMDVGSTIKGDFWADLVAYVGGNVIGHHITDKDGTPFNSLIFDAQSSMTEKMESDHNDGVYLFVTKTSITEVEEARFSVYTTLGLYELEDFDDRRNI